MVDPDCVFCQIGTQALPASTVYEDEHCFAFLDNRPVFPGHILLCPRDHYPTLSDLPDTLAKPLLAATRLLSNALEAAVDAQGSFVAINNKVSQSVPHLHIHIIPRRKKDGLRGFFWPRRKYPDNAAQESVAAAIRKQLQTVPPA